MCDAIDAKYEFCLCLCDKYCLIISFFLSLLENASLLATTPPPNLDYKLEEMKINGHLSSTSNLNCVFHWSTNLSICFN